MAGYLTAKKFLQTAVMDNFIFLMNKKPASFFYEAGFFINGVPDKYYPTNAL